LNKYSLVQDGRAHAGHSLVQDGGGEPEMTPVQQTIIFRYMVDINSLVQDGSAHMGNF